MFVIEAEKEGEEKICKEENEETEKGGEEETCERKKRDNYNKPTCGIVRFHFVYLCFNHLHFAHLNFNLLSISYPPHHQMLEKHIFIQN